jgi:hypothetical protein
MTVDQTDRRATTIRPALRSGPNNRKTPKFGCHAHCFALLCVGVRIRLTLEGTPTLTFGEP